MESGEYLEYSIEVGSCDIDMWGFLKPTMILNLCQESAYMHSSQRGFGYHNLLEQGVAWVLSRAKAEIKRLPQWGEKITIRTWHKGQSGLFSLRDYAFTDAQGNQIIAATTSWLIINLATRRISRVDRVFAADDAFRLLEYKCDAVEQEAHRVVVPSDKVWLSEHHVRYSDMDVNHHVNNVRYMEWACDNSTQQMDQKCRLAGFCINFNHEAKFDERVRLSGSTTSNDDTLFVEGTIEDRNIFCVELNYTQK